MGLGKICGLCCVNEQGEVQNDWKLSFLPLRDYYKIQ